MKIQKRSLSRIIAVQVMYSYLTTKCNVEDTLLDVMSLYESGHMEKFYCDNKDIEVDIDVTTNSKEKEKDEKKVKSRKNISKIDKPYLRFLINGVQENKKSIDHSITTALNNKESFSNMYMLLYVILSIAIQEIMSKRTPKVVVINEYTNLASTMLDEKKTALVNYILHNYPIEHENALN